MTPSWIPHATVNQPTHQQGDDPAVKASAHEKKVRTISDSQRRFAAQFSSPTHSEVERQGDPQVARGNRWTLKSTRSTATSNSPGESCRAEERRLQRANQHMSITHRAAESGQRLQKTEFLGIKVQGDHDSMEKADNMDWSCRTSKEEKGDPPRNVSTARCQTAVCLGEKNDGDRCLLCSFVCQYVPITTYLANTL